MINNLFLIKDEKEYQIANKIIETRKLEDFVILSLDLKEPYLVDKYSHLDNVMRWEDFDVPNLDFNRYWMEEYKQIEKTVRQIIEENYDNEMARSPHYIFGLVWKLGDGFYKYIDALNTFFKYYRPDAIIFATEEGFISTLILSFMKLYKVEHNDLTI